MLIFGTRHDKHKNFCTLSSGCCCHNTITKAKAQKATAFYVSHLMLRFSGSCYCFLELNTLTTPILGFDKI